MYDIETDFENTFENSEFEQNSRTNEFEPSSRSFSDSRDGEEETEVVEELRKTVDLLKVSCQNFWPFEGYVPKMSTFWKFRTKNIDLLDLSYQ